MNSKYLVLGLVVILLIGGFIFLSKRGDSQLQFSTEKEKINTYPEPTPVVPSAGVSVVPVGTTTVSTSSKEFKMNSWMETVDGKMSAHFGLKEMVVKKGDIVRIKITNTAGIHDFIIDEYKIDLDTPLNQEVMVEFVADKVGDFEYYCSKYNHRSIGQKGILRVVE